MSEVEDAIRLANKVLDEPGRDPDDDLSMLARQFLRARQARNSAVVVLGFFASIIKSSEAWSETCEREYRRVIGL